MRHTRPYCEAPIPPGSLAPSLQWNQDSGLKWALCSSCQRTDKGKLCPASEPCPAHPTTPPSVEPSPCQQPPHPRPQAGRSGSGAEPLSGTSPSSDLPCGSTQMRKYLRQLWPGIWQHRNGGRGGPCNCPSHQRARGGGARGPSLSPGACATERRDRCHLAEVSAQQQQQGDGPDDPSRSLPGPRGRDLCTHRDVGASALPAAQPAGSPTTFSEPGHAQALPSWNLLSPPISDRAGMQGAGVTPENVSVRDGVGTGGVPGSRVGGGNQPLPPAAPPPHRSPRSSGVRQARYGFRVSGRSGPETGIRRFCQAPR